LKKVNEISLDLRDVNMTDHNHWLYHGILMILYTGFSFEHLVERADMSKKVLNSRLVLRQPTTTTDRDTAY